MFWKKFLQYLPQTGSIFAYFWKSHRKSQIFTEFCEVFTEKNFFCDNVYTKWLWTYFMEKILAIFTTNRVNFCLFLKISQNVTDFHRDLWSFHRKKYSHRNFCEIFWHFFHKFPKILSNFSIKQRKWEKNF